MATKKVKPKAKATKRPKPLVHTPSLTRTRRRFECGGKITTKKTS